MRRGVFDKFIKSESYLRLRGALPSGVLIRIDSRRKFENELLLQLTGLIFALGRVVDSNLMTVFKSFNHFVNTRGERARN